MARPKIIADIHEARYELRMSDGDDALHWQKEYERLLDAAAEEYKTDRLHLKGAIAPDFHKWVKENNLPNLGSKDKR